MENLIDIKELLIAVGAKESEIEPEIDGGSFTLVDVNISPIDFLSQAEIDFEENTKTSLANCLTNAKRAVVSQIDQILISVGYKSFRFNVPQKLEKLKRLGVLSPSALRKIVQARNLLEHEYEVFTKDEIEGYLDTASLFVLGMAALFKPYSDTLHIKLRKDGEIVGYLDCGIHERKSGVFYSIYGFELIKETPVNRGHAYVDINTSLFPALMALGSALEYNYKVTEAIDRVKLSIHDLIK
ncbi:hypothetical protein QK371_08765 [Pseudomonas aeruginosa]|nr:hypothetical protein [Pseudomonas aeruginosa]MDI3717082.1 hypothetical protein [Pseudomonas aeruginosa]MDI3843591.1 hypothetical protein [Pseudomonas aeruginosa]MDI4144538.1 hypothetical protein [Pseudomonas aeruginosa]MDI4189210.1 hypothetical protein [Pseudomonas aeruginosa]